ncbi:MAG: YlxR family protein [Anaerolineaceae bacterium]|nr:YlxR family protein [Anaerolineaceae bacterium]
MMNAAHQQQHRKRIPIRTCVVCRTKEGKRALFRIVRTEDGVQVDPTGKMNGRGAYLCGDPDCWERAAATDILSKALRTTLTADDRARLRQARPSP